MIDDVANEGVMKMRCDGMLAEIVRTREGGGEIGELREIVMTKRDSND